MRGSIVFGFAICAAAVAAIAVARMYPTVSSLSPEDGYEDVHPARDLRAGLSRNIPTGDISVRLESGRQAVPVTFTLDRREHQLRINPAIPLVWATDYSLCVTAARFSRPLPRFLLSLFGERRCTNFHTMDEPAAAPSPAAPILIATGGAEPFASYYSEILKAEGLNLFATADAAQLDQAMLARREVVLLAGASLGRPALDALSDWVDAGGLLIAMRPGPELLPLMGLAKTEGPAPRRRLYIATTPDEPAGAAMAGELLRVHGDHDFYELSMTHTASAAATAPDTPTIIAHFAAADGHLSYPAVTMRAVGAGAAVAFAYDLARSVALTRQGNPEWKNQERDGSAPRRPNDLFFPDFVDIDNLAVPQADEQQRLLANLILTAAPIPLPRYWYLPQNRRAALVMIADDHATIAGTSKLFSRMVQLSPPDCRMEEWTCLRATALLTPKKKFATNLAERFHNLGFELGAHIDTGCRNESREAFRATLAGQLRDFQAKYPMLPKQVTSRTHCIAWSGWVNPARAEAQDGIRLDFNYYHWPPEWLKGRSGFLTGSGFPMPFVDEDGRVLDVYQAETHLVNEDGAPQREGISSMLDRALDEHQYFGAFGTHFDYSDGYSGLLIEEAQKRGVALISAVQLLAWTDGRNSSAFTDLAWRGRQLSFTQTVGPGAENADVMLPYLPNGLRMAGIECAGKRLDYSTEIIKGLEYAFFPARSGRCVARYVGQ